MPSVDFETLTKPISPDEPCGPDLDAQGDTGFLNFFASVESTLPQSYFRARDPESGDLRLFDPKMIPLDQYFDDAREFIGKTRDIRLTVLLAKLSILNRDLAGFADCVKALALFLDQYWEAVHPRAEDGDFTYRGIALEALDVTPTVTMPLHFVPIVRDRRVGLITYRHFLTASGTIPPSEGETTLDAPTLERVLDTCDIDDLTRVHSLIQDVLAAVAEIRKSWSTKSDSGQSISFEQLSAEAGAIARWLGDALKRRSPGFGTDETSDGTATDDDAESGAPAGGASPTGSIKSSAHAAKALAAVAQYYAAHESSSPARLLIGLSERLIGKSFTEIVRILTPDYAEQAAIKIGSDGLLGLPIERITGTLEESRSEAASHADADVPEIVVTSRTQALATLDQVSTFFRMAEPSSPIPVVLERVRDLGQRDFLYLLRSVLPPDALRSND